MSLNSLVGIISSLLAALIVAGIAFAWGLWGLVALCAAMLILACGYRLGSGRWP